MPFSSMLVGTVLAACVSVAAACSEDDGDRVRLYHASALPASYTADAVAALAHLGPTVVDRGVNFGVYSERATRVEVLLFDDPESPRPTRQFPMARFGDVWNVHVEGIGQAAEGLDLVGAASLQEALDRVAKGARALPPGEWLIGRGWDQNDWTEKRFPTAAELWRELCGSRPSYSVTVPSQLTGALDSKCGEKLWWAEASTTHTTLMKMAISEAMWLARMWPP